MRILAPEPKALAPRAELKPGQAYRTQNKQHDPARDLRDYSDLTQRLIIELSNLTKVECKAFYKKQDDEVMQLLRRAFLKGENNSMLLLARSKQTMHSFISAATEEIK